MLVKKSDAVVFDSALGLVWFTAKKRLYVLDLNAPVANAVAIASITRSKKVRITIARGKHKVSSNDLPEHQQVWHELVLTWSTQPTATAGRNPMTIVNRAWLRKHYRRPLAAANTSPTVALRKRMWVPRNRCHKKKSCGMYANLPGTRLRLVVVNQQCNEGCVVFCGVYDPKNRQLTAGAPKRRKWRKRLRFGHWSECVRAYHRSNKHFAVPSFVQDSNGKWAHTWVCTSSAGKCTAFKGHFVGWLDGGVRIGDPNWDGG